MFNTFWSMMKEYMYSVLVIAVLVSCVCMSDAHVRFWNPLSRSTMFRRYPTEAKATNYDDNGLFCGGYWVIIQLLVVKIYFYNQIEIQWKI